MHASVHVTAAASALSLVPRPSSPCFASQGEQEQVVCACAQTESDGGNGEREVEIEERAATPSPDAHDDPCSPTEQCSYAQLNRQHSACS